MVNKLSENEATRLANGDKTMEELLVSLNKALPTNSLTKKCQSHQNAKKIATFVKKVEGDIKSSIQDEIGDTEKGTPYQAGTFEISNTPFQKASPAYARMIDEIIQYVDGKKEAINPITMKKAINRIRAKHSKVKCQYKFEVRV